MKTGAIKLMAGISICRVAATILALCIVLVIPIPVIAQDFSGAFAGMQESDKPIEIEADRLEVKDKQGIALFTGNVHVVQGSTILEAARMKVTYIKGGKGPNGNLKYLEATGTIVVKSGDQTVSAEKGEFNMLKQTVKLSGNVVITQGTNVITGCILDVNLETSSAILKPCNSKQGVGKQRPKLLFQPKN